MQSFAFDSHKPYAWALVQDKTGRTVRERLPVLATSFRRCPRNPGLTSPCRRANGSLCKRQLESAVRS
jgi:hypothetical protein